MKLLRPDKAIVKLQTFIATNRRVPSLSEVSSALGRRSALSFPTLIQLEPTTRCNLDCITCSRTSLAKSRLNKDLSVAQFNDMLLQIPAGTTLKLQGLGEPLLNRDIWEIAHNAKAKGVKLTTITNGTLIDSSNTDRILQYLDSIAISLDSTDPENYRQIRRKGELAKLLVNIDFLMERKRQMKSKTKVYLIFVVTNLNVHELKNYFELCQNLGVNCYIGEVENWYISSQSQYQSQSEFIQRCRLSHDRIMKDVHLAMPRFVANGLSISYLSAAKRKETCIRPFQWCFITVDGYVTPCCIRTDPDVFNFGNVYQTPLKEIWNSIEFKEFRSRMTRGESLPICDYCPD